MHHVHISTGALIVMAISFLGLIALMVWAVSNRKNRRDEIALERDRIKAGIGMRNPQATTGFGAPAAGSSSYRQSAPTAAQSMAPAYAAGGSGGGGSDMMMGVMLGSMIGGHHDTTVIHDRAPSYDPAPAPSSDGGSSGGIDISWGSDSGSSDSSSFGGC